MDKKEVYTPHPLTQYDGCMNTMSGIKFNIFEPQVSMINIEDIIAGLSNKGHFSGQTERFFSIAEHCLLVYKLMTNDCTVQLPHSFFAAALLHDASEAYIGDMIKPLKIHIPQFKAIEDKIMKVIGHAFGFGSVDMAFIKRFDVEAQQIEYDCFYKGVENDLIHWLSPEVAAVYFRRVLNHHAIY